MKNMKILGGLLAAVVLLYLIALNFSEVESRYECAGTYTKDGLEQPTTAFLKLNKYRFWVGLWSDSRGSVWIEVPNKTVEYFEHVQGDDLLAFKNTQHGNGLDSDQGTFWLLSGALNFEIRYWGKFNGACKAIRE